MSKPTQTAPAENKKATEAEAKEEAPVVLKFQISDKCTSCGDCIPLCPTESIFFGTLHFEIDTDGCDGHQLCVQVCPENAILPVPPSE